MESYQKYTTYKYICESAYIRRERVGGAHREREENIVDLGIDCPSDESWTLMKIILLSYVYTTLDST